MTPSHYANAESFIHIKVKSTLSENETFEINVSEKTTVKKLKSIIWSKLDVKDENKTIRLIHCGKLLQPDTKILKDFEIENDSFIHAVISQRKGDNVTNESISNDENIVNSSSNSHISNRGFERLLQGGSFSASEISVLRTVFRQSIVDTLRNHLPRRNDESENDYHLRLEEHFIDSQNQGVRVPILHFMNTHSNITNNNSPFSQVMGLTSGGIINSRTQSQSDSDSNSDDTSDDLGTTKDFMMGFLIGFTIGFLVIFCVWDRNLSHRQKVGLLCGVATATLLEMYSSEKLSTPISSDSHMALRGSTVNRTDST